LWSIYRLENKKKNKKKNKINGRKSTAANGYRPHNTMGGTAEHCIQATIASLQFT
jgi:hypothetical protein